MSEDTPEPRNKMVYTEEQKLRYREAYYRTLYQGVCTDAGIEPLEPPEDWQ